ncbi:hypothetical protein PUNSTDRAFT_130519 [Punctularia strigosozonata HHB-11173 SS5]|uniref:uncharacterized protein n=1 Tax=Punctularia strigosozonata (strain HHB-11173) TaxID=741275 RepID=UPI0004416344|nr:uncharacterized protein PUNSTDRAFT_130519 [Punctularia strigosozonata HHB-11173 SS5]EIN12253.1 hypothetical protein PUNSTDRAFT_130519 [Punctularia strigosozonata HHB-11173 SS5]
MLVSPSKSRLRRTRPLDDTGEQTRAQAPKKAHSTSSRAPVRKTAKGASKDVAIDKEPDVTGSTGREWSPVHELPITDSNGENPRSSPALPEQDFHSGDIGSTEQHPLLDIPPGVKSPPIVNSSIYAQYPPTSPIMAATALGPDCQPIQPLHFLSSSAAAAVIADSGLLATINARVIDGTFNAGNPNVTSIGGQTSANDEDNDPISGNDPRRRQPTEFNIEPVRSDDAGDVEPDRVVDDTAGGDGRAKQGSAGSGEDEDYDMLSTNNNEEVGEDRGREQSGNGLDAPPSEDKGREDEAEEGDKEDEEGDREDEEEDEEDEEEEDDEDEDEEDEEVDRDAANKYESHIGGEDDAERTMDESEEEEAEPIGDVEDAQDDDDKNSDQGEDATGSVTSARRTSGRTRRPSWKMNQLMQDSDEDPPSSDDFVLADPDTHSDTARRKETTIEEQDDEDDMELEQEVVDSDQDRRKRKVKRKITQPPHRKGSHSNDTSSKSAPGELKSTKSSETKTPKRKASAVGYETLSEPSAEDLAKARTRRDHARERSKAGVTTTTSDSSSNNDEGELMIDQLAMDDDAMDVDTPTVKAPLKGGATVKMNRPKGRSAGDAKRTACAKINDKSHAASARKADMEPPAGSSSDEAITIDPAAGGMDKSQAKASIPRRKAGASKGDRTTIASNRDTAHALSSDIGKGKAKDMSAVSTTKSGAKISKPQPTGQGQSRDREGRAEICDKWKGKAIDPDSKPKPGPLSKKHQAMIEAEIERIDEFINEIAKAADKPVAVIADMLNTWSCFETYHSQTHGRGDKETEQEYARRRQEDYYAVTKGIPKDDKAKREEAFRPYIDWYIDYMDLASEKAAKKGGAEKDLRQAASEMTKLGRHLFKTKGLHVVGYILNIRPGGTGLMFRNSPQVMQMQKEYETDHLANIAAYQARLMGIDLTNKGITIPSVSGTPSQTSSARRPQLPVQKPNEAGRDYRNRVLTELIKWKFKLANVETVKYKLWAAILELLYTNKLRIIDMHPDSNYTICKSRTIEFDLKAPGNGPVVSQMIAPWVENDPDGIKFDIVPWSEEESALPLDKQKDVPLILTWLHNEENVVPNGTSIIMYGHFKQGVKWRVSSTARYQHDLAVASGQAQDATPAGASESGQKCRIPTCKDPSNQRSTSAAGSTESTLVSSSRSNTAALATNPRTSSVAPNSNYRQPSVAPYSHPSAVVPPYQTIETHLDADNVTGYTQDFDDPWLTIEDDNGQMASTQWQESGNDYDPSNTRMNSPFEPAPPSPRRPTGFTNPDQYRDWPPDPIPENIDMSRAVFSRPGSGASRPVTTTGRSAASHYVTPLPDTRATHTREPTYAAPIPNGISFQSRERQNARYGTPSTYAGPETGHATSRASGSMDTDDGAPTPYAAPVMDRASSRASSRADGNHGSSIVYAPPMLDRTASRMSTRLAVDDRGSLPDHSAFAADAVSTPAQDAILVDRHTMYAQPMVPPTSVQSTRQYGLDRSSTASMRTFEPDMYFQDGPRAPSQFEDRDDYHTSSLNLEHDVYRTGRASVPRRVVPALGAIQEDEPDRIQQGFMSQRPAALSSRHRLSQGHRVLDLNPDRSPVNLNHPSRHRLSQGHRVLDLNPDRSPVNLNHPSRHRLSQGHHVLNLNTDQSPFSPALDLLLISYSSS